MYKRCPPPQKKIRPLCRHHEEKILSCYWEVRMLRCRRHQILPSHWPERTRSRLPICPRESFICRSHFVEFSLTQQDNRRANLGGGGGQDNVPQDIFSSYINQCISNVKFIRFIVFCPHEKCLCPSSPGQQLTRFIELFIKRDAKDNELPVSVQYICQDKEFTLPHNFDFIQQKIVSEIFTFRGL